MELEHWINTVKNTRVFPVRKSSIDRLNVLKGLGATQMNFTALSNVILADPMLVFQLIRHVSSIERLRESLSETICIEFAVMTIGVDKFFRIFNNIPALESYVPDASYLKASKTAYARARFSAWLTKEWLALNDERRVEEYFVAALLYQIPYCILAIEEKIDFNQTPDEFANRCFGTDYNRLLSELLKNFNVSVKVRELLLNLRQEDDRRKLVLHATIRLVDNFHKGWWTKEVVESMQKVASYLRVPVDEVDNVMKKIALYLAHEGEDVGFSRFARQLALTPCPPVISENEFLFISQNKVSGKIGLNDIIMETMGRLWLQLGVERILFFAKDDFDTLQMRFRVGEICSDKLPHLSIKISESSFFSAFCTKTQGLHVTSEKVSMIRSKFGDEFFNLIPDCGFSMVSLFTKDDFYGLFYIDNSISHSEVDQNTYNLFKNAIFKMLYRLNGI